MTRYIFISAVLLIAFIAWYLGWKNVSAVDAVSGVQSEVPAIEVDPLPVIPGGSVMSSNKISAASEDDNKLESELDLEQRYAEISNNEDYPTLEGRVSAMSERRSGLAFTQNEVLDAMEGDPWEEVDEVPGALVLTEEDKTDGREFIKFNPLKIESLMPGDTLKMPISQLGEEYQVQIENVITNEGGSLTWEGKLLNDPEGNKVIITQSEKITVAGISTGQGHYALQAHNGVGWIASSQTLFKQNPNESDAIEVPDDK